MSRRFPKLVTRGLVCSAVLFLLCSLVVFCLLPVGSSDPQDETFQLGLGNDGRYNTTRTLSNTSRHIYHLRGESPCVLHYLVNITGNGSFQLFFVEGHTNDTTGYLPEYSSDTNTTKKAKSYLMRYQDDEKVTMVIITEENSTIDYNIWLGTADRSDLFGSSTLFMRRVLIGTGVASIIVLVGVIHKFRKSPKYRDSFRTIRFFPQEVAEFFQSVPEKYESPLQAHGSLVPRTKYAMSRGDGTASCPFCKTVLEGEDSGYRFRVIQFTDETPSPGQGGGMERKVWRALAVYCWNCGMMIGVTR